jgi:hypothetical protein
VEERKMKKSIDLDALDLVGLLKYSQEHTDINEKKYAKSSANSRFSKELDITMILQSQTMHNVNMKKFTRELAMEFLYDMLSIQKMTELKSESRSDDEKLLLTDLIKKQKSMT